MYIVVSEVCKLLEPHYEAWLYEKILLLMFGMMLREVRFLLFGHFEVGVIVRIDELD